MTTAVTTSVDDPTSPLIDAPTAPPTNPLPLAHAALLSLAAASLYGLAFALPSAGTIILLALPCLCLLARVSTPRRAFYVGLLAGLCTYVPHLLFFHAIFGLYAALLWIVVAFPVGLFVLLHHHARRTLRPSLALLITPVLWTGIEYFRSEVWHLRFAWLLPGQAVAFRPGIELAALGVYGLGFAFVLVAAFVLSSHALHRCLGYLGIVALILAMHTVGPKREAPTSMLRVAGVQLEHPREEEVVTSLDRLATTYPDAQLLVLSEYTFQGPVPESVREVLRRNKRYLVAGGTRPLDHDRFENTAYVVGPDGQDLFSQAKCVPVQFMADGLPARQQRVWDSPWGKIGILICYDLSYARVTDELIRQGAQGLIIPTMDEVSWGEYERRLLHGRLAPIRSVEHNVPTFGVWSSGVSQLTDRHGRVLATAAYPGQGDTISGPFELSSAPRIPPDRILAAACVAATGAFIAFLAIRGIRRRLMK